MARPGNNEPAVESAGQLSYGLIMKVFHSAMFAKGSTYILLGPKKFTCVRFVTSASVHQH